MNILIQPSLKSDLEEILKLQKECYRAEAEIYNDFTIPPLTQDLTSLQATTSNFSSEKLTSPAIA